MNKFTVWLAGLAGLVLAGTAGAVTVTLNGTTKTVASISITHTQNGIVISSADLAFADGAGGGETPPPVEPPPVEPPPVEPPPVEPPPSSGACVESSTQRCGAINWASPGGRLTGSIPGLNMTQSWQFTTTTNPQFAGDINVAETTGYEGVMRRLWISTEPGGPALANSRCSSEGNSNRKISWGQSQMFLRCPLAPNTTYFLNLKNVSGCASTSNCGFYRNTVVVGTP